MLFLGAGHTPDELVERRERVLAMPVAEQRELLRNEARLATLPEAEQERLRTLDRELRSDPQGEHLRRLLAQYHEWLKTLPPGVRAELAALAPEDRVARIKTLRQQSQVRQGLSDEDLRRIAQWLETFVWERKERWLADLPADKRQQLESLAEPARKRMMLGMAVQRWQQAGMGEQPTLEDFRTLLSQLSPEAQQRLSRIEGPTEKRALLKDWMQAAMQKHYESFGGRVLSPIPPAELERFFTQVLTVEERERLLNMPREMMQRELRRLFELDTRSGFRRPNMPGDGGMPRRPIGGAGRPNEPPINPRPGGRQPPTGRD